MTELLPQGTSTWPSSFTAGLHAALRRRIPPRADGPALEELSRDLVLALEQGELTVALTPERLAAAQASGWPSSFAAGLHAALQRRIPPQRGGPDLEELSRDLVLALEQGELTVALTPERLAVAESSGWLEGEASPLLRQGDRLGWRR